MSPWARAPVASIVSFDNALFKHEVQDLSGFILLLLIRLQLGVLVHDLLKEGELLLNGTLFCFGCQLLILDLLASSSALTSYLHEVSTGASGF